MLLKKGVYLQRHNNIGAVVDVGDDVVELFAVLHAHNNGATDVVLIATVALFAGHPLFARNVVGNYGVDGVNKLFGILAKHF